eukprot:PLAT12464.13.p1 GENE.PLAT12464.13~~PLAT12464.13.p1  ORF type:complete len:222 (-),score=30.22 PLAT12464.13:231-857(-)
MAHAACLPHARTCMSCRAHTPLAFRHNTPTLADSLLSPLTHMHTRTQAAMQPLLLSLQLLLLLLLLAAHSLRQQSNMRAAASSCACKGFVGCSQAAGASVRQLSLGNVNRAWQRTGAVCTGRKESEGREQTANQARSSCLLAKCGRLVVRVVTGGSGARSSVPLLFLLLLAVFIALARDSCATNKAQAVAEDSPSAAAIRAFVEELMA